MPLPLTEDDYKQAAQKLGCEVAAIKAVAEVDRVPMEHSCRQAIR